MPVPIPGDIIRIDDGRVVSRRVVVDVPDVDGDTFVVHRAKHDLDGEHLAACSAADVEVVGHLDSVPGWVQDVPGQWRRGDAS